MSETYDFVVVGSGPAGAVIASRLAKSNAAPSVLLLEAGGANEDITFEQNMLFNKFRSKDYPNLNWHYKTAPQENLGGRAVDYSRGKALGGSSIINYGVWTVGPKDDYDEWARIVGDESFAWQHMQRRLRKLERYSIKTDAAYTRYVKPHHDDHGSSGDLDIESAVSIEPEMLEGFDMMRSAGATMNLDQNSGDPIGVGLPPMTARRAMRSTAKSAFLSDVPSNLTIRTDSFVSKIVFEEQTAVGVESNGVLLRASKEIILCCGALDSPKLLMLSGVGEGQELAKHNIPLVSNVPGVGKNLQDHPFLIWVGQRRAPPNKSYDVCHDSSAMEAARQQLEHDGTGPLAVNGMTSLVGFLKDEQLLSSEHFSALPKQVQEHLQRPTVPAYETTWRLISPLPGMDPTKSYMLSAMFVQNPQSKGTVRLASSNPLDAPICDPAIYSHPFDRENAIRSLRNALTFPGCPGSWDGDDIADRMSTPTALDDDTLWAHLQQNTNTSWHMSCTVKMGKADDPEACVDADFRVRETKRLRCADMSVTPFLPSCHTVSVAYLIGETAAEKLIQEYELDAAV